MKLVRVECPKCHSPLFSKQRAEDLLFLCDCGTMHVRDPAPKEVAYEIAEQVDSTREGSVYLPFWRIVTHFKILSSEVEGAFLYKLSSLFRGEEKSSGRVDVFVPGTKLPAEEFMRWAITFTNNPPRYSRASHFGGTRRMPCNISQREAEEFADFVILTNEAEKPGVLQRLQYEMTVGNTSVVFLPFWRDSRGRLLVNL